MGLVFTVINIHNFSNKNVHFLKKESNYLFILRDLSYFLLCIKDCSLIKKKLFLSDYSMEFSVEYSITKIFDSYTHNLFFLGKCAYCP